MAALDPLVCTRYAIDLGTSTNTLSDYASQADLFPNYYSWADAKTAAEGRWPIPFADANAGNMAFYKVGSQGGHYDPPVNKYVSWLVAASTTNFSWSTMPNSLTNKALPSVAYIALYPFDRFNTVSPATATNKVFDTFGQYTNFAAWTVHSFTNATVSTKGTDQWTIGRKAASYTEIMPWCDEPDASGGVEDFDLRPTRGYMMSSAFGRWWLQTMHTNWMTKW
jgi:hypothetical protein